MSLVVAVERKRNGPWAPDLFPSRYRRRPQAVAGVFVPAVVTFSGTWLRNGSEEPDTAERAEGGGGQGLALLPHRETVGTEGKLDLTPRRSRRLSSVGYSRSKQDPRHYSWAVAAYALRSGRPHKGRLEVLALLRFRGLLNPVKHPAARLDNGTGSNPVSSHPVGYGVRLSVFVSSPRGRHAGMPARVSLTNRWRS